MTALVIGSARIVLTSSWKPKLKSKVVAAAVSNNGHRRNVSNSPADDKHLKMYEFRQYNIYPHHMKSFVELSLKHMDLRTKHSKMIGYWMTELGGINQAVHIWEYDNFAHRSEVRKSLAADEAWVQSYFSKVLLMFQSQENSVLSLLPWSPLISDIPAGGIYELQTLRYKNQDLPTWDADLQNYVTARGQTITLAGAFHTTMAGNRNTSVQLWHYPSAGDLETKQAQCERDPDTARNYSALMKKVSEENVKILVPQPWSPMK